MATPPMPTIRDLKAYVPAKDFENFADSTGPFSEI